MTPSLSEKRSKSEKRSNREVLLRCIHDACDDITQGCWIGGRGPGGGIIFHIDGSNAYEVSEVLGKHRWDEAKRVAEGYRGGGFGDWRLPTKEELNLVYRRLRKPGVITGDETFWSSSQYNGSHPDFHRAQRFGDGFGDWRLPTKEELDLVYQRLRKPGVITDDEWFWSSSKTTSRSETNSLVSVLRRAHGYGDIYDIYWAVRFSDGGQDNYRDYSVFCVRAIRVFNIEE